MTKNDLISILPDYDEIMDRQREAEEMKAEMRGAKIAQLQKEYFGDAGTFFEFIQSIEIADIDINWFESWHKYLIQEKLVLTGACIYALFEIYCEEKAIEEMEDEE